MPSRIKVASGTENSSGLVEKQNIYLNNYALPLHAELQKIKVYLKLNLSK
jgi:hypothetical protein